MRVKRRVAVLAIALLSVGTTSVIVGSAPVGAATNCSTLKNKFRVDPTPATIETLGGVVKTFTGRCLASNAQYILHEPACTFGADRTETTDGSGILVDQATLSNCTPGTYYTTLTENFGAHRVYLVKERLTIPVPCAAGSSSTIAAVPNNAPRYLGTTVEQTLVGECYPPSATVNVHLTACGGVNFTKGTDRFGRFYVGFSSTTCFSPGSFPMTVTANNYPPFGAIVATGTQKIDP